MFVIKPTAASSEQRSAIVGSPETSVNFYQTARRRTKEDSKLCKYPSSECTNVQAALGCDVTFMVLTPLVHIMVCVM